MNDPIAVASSFAAERFPKALAVIISGSAAAGTATATSDLDIGVVQPSEAETFRSTFRFEGWLVELFAHTPDNLPLLWAKDVKGRRGTMVFMYATGVLIAERDGNGGQFQSRARQILSGGPGPLGLDALTMLRYRLSGSLDDLADLTDVAERAACAEGVLCDTVDLVCAAANRWTGRGK